MWIAVGYSFRDEPIQRVLERGAVRGTIKGLVILNPADDLPYPPELESVTSHIKLGFDDGGTAEVLLKVSELLGLWREDAQGDGDKAPGEAEGQ